MKRNQRWILGLVWLMILVAIVSSVLTLMVSGSGARRYARLDTIRETLLEGYYEEIDEEDLIQGAIDGMMAAVGDSYTFYYTPEEMQEHAQETGEGYSGMGLLVQNNEDGYIEILRVYEGGPADAAGICAGDLLVGIDDAAVSGESSQSLNDAVERMQGETGTALRLTILRGGETLEFELVTGEVAINNVVYRLIDGSIGYINIFQFSGNDVEGFEAALEDLQAEGARALIVDVRNNPGGLLDDVVAIADSLLGEGLIVYTQDREGRQERYTSDAAHCDLPMAVLVNGMSASASEILAAAVQDHGRGAVIGQRTYGKGIVQTLVRFESDGAGMQYTSACYYTPSGKNIHGTGVTPDITVEPQEDFYSYTGMPDPENDVQLQCAIEYLSGE